MGWFLRSKKEQREHERQKKERREESERKSRVENTIAYHEKEAIHRGRMKYLEREASKGKIGGGGGWSGIGDFFAGGAKTLLSNASASSGKSMFDLGPASGGGRRKGGGYGGGGFDLGTSTTLGGGLYPGAHERARKRIRAHRGKRKVVVYV